MGGMEGRRDYVSKRCGFWKTDVARNMAKQGVEYALPSPAKDSAHTSIPIRLYKCPWV